MRFSVTNLCTEAATTVTASSANPNFPASNLKNPLRSKRWRSAGTFEVSATNNKIDFKEASGGVQLTATITSGTYSTSGLALEIKTRMQAAGVAVYTVTFSSTTGLWTIASSGAFFSLLNTSGTNAAASLLKASLGFPNTDKLGALTYTGSTIAIHTKERIVFDMKTAQDISLVSLFWPKEDGIKLSSSAVVKIEANATNVWTSPAVSQTLTVDDTYMVASHFPATPMSYRYMSVTIEDASNPYLYVELGLAWIGEDLGFSEPENGFKFNISDNSNISRTDFGHEYVDEYPQTVSVDFNYSFIQYATAQAIEAAYRKNGSRKPVLCVFDDQQLVFDKDHFLVYGKMEKSFGLSHVSFDLFSGGLKITELG